MTPGIDIWTRPWEERRDVVALVADAGIDHVFFADHVSFRVGHGHDGMVVAAAVANLHPTIGIYIGVYLLPLRHPLPVARQLANLGEMAPGRISFGVGVGGDDRHEVEVCGVDPKTRGKRTDESLEIVQRLLSGETFDYSGEFFQFEQARIIPVPDPAIPVYVGGRADAALRRAGRYADGWLGIWCSSERYAESIELFDDLHCVSIDTSRIRQSIDKLITTISDDEVVWNYIDDGSDVNTVGIMVNSIKISNIMHSKICTAFVNRTATSSS